MYSYGCCPPQQNQGYSCGFGGGFALIVVLFILLIIVGASFY
ncbi:YjcZ family sporulation protein [Amphibacillus sp. MSJ-3]|nr:YjcZ family sporulation protein [Amphibacillus sp. MSJ-3]MBU5595478.1 YjcZ family sporulation protein [Amphibacillus sp. MSJ-3]